MSEIFESLFFENVPLQGIDHRNLVAKHLNTVFTWFKLFRMWKTRVGGVVKFLELIDLYSIVYKGLYNGTEGVIPADGLGLDGGVFVGIRSRSGLHNGFVLEIVVANCLKIVIVHPKDGVEFGKNKCSLRLDEMRYCLCPFIHIG